MTSATCWPDASPDPPTRRASTALPQAPRPPSPGAKRGGSGRRGNTSPGQRLALHCRLNFLINDEKTVLKALKKIFAKTPDEQPGSQVIATPEKQGADAQPSHAAPASRNDDAPS